MLQLYNQKLMRGYHIGQLSKGIIVVFKYFVYYLFIKSCISYIYYYY